MEGIHGEEHPYDVTEIRKIIEKSDNFVFFTGAGISRESGIPTFRDNDGLWKKYDPAKLASHSAFISNPKLVWDFFYRRLEAEPGQNQSRAPAELFCRRNFPPGGGNRSHRHHQ
jgi:NAD-dependent SIR2 family protein deacetylase